jgi:ribonuclease E
MAKEMLINVSEGEECRIALVEDGRLEELYMERSSSTSHVGNIYKGRVTNVEASIQAAFVDFGLGRNGFLHISDLMPTYFGRKGEDIQESVGRKMARRDRPPIQRCLRRGDEIIVQIIKEGIGTKGPTLSSYLSIPGRILVMMPGMANKGVSKKIEDDEERRRLRQILDGLKPPKDVGFIIRTAGIGKTKAEIQRDFTYLTRLWMLIEKKLQSGSGPMELYTEGDLVSRTVRDVYSPDIDTIVVDNKDVAKRVKDVIKLANPRAKNKVDLYEEPIPLFHKYDIEKDIEMMYSRHVPLPSGGSLVIDSTEAIVAIDVNSGKFRDHSDAETTAFKTDMEAADEIPRQLRLRDLGGVIIVDFIDLRYERHRRELEQKLHDAFKNDRAKTKVLRMSQFGIIEMTRQRMRPSLKRSIYADCPHCKGAALVKTPESMSLDVMRRLAIAAHDERVVRIELAVHPEAAFYLQNRKRAALANLENETNKPVLVRTDDSLALDEAKLELYDARDGKIYIAELGMSPEQPQGPRRHQQHGAPPAGKPGGRPGRGDRDRKQPPAAAGRRREAEPLEEKFDLDRGEEAVDEREETREGESSEAALVTSPVQPPQPRPAFDERAERPESYSNYTDNDVDLGDDEEEAEPPRRDQAPQGGQRNEPRRDQRPEPRNDQRRDQRQAPRPDQRGQGQRGGQGGQRGPRIDQWQNPNRAPQQGQPPRPPQVQQPQRPPQGQPHQRGPQGQPEGGPTNAEGQPLDQQSAPGEGGGRRRRRRRGGRGRGRNRNRQELGQDGLPLQNGQPPAFPQGEEDRGDEGMREGGFDEPQEAFEERPEGAQDESRHDDRDEAREEVTSEAPSAREPEVIAEPEPVAAEEPAAEVKPGRKRKPAAPAKAPRGRGKKSAEAAEKKPAKAAKEPSKRSERKTETPVVEPLVRTGSTDRHQLIIEESDEEPLVPSPAVVRRPRTYRDLDEIPDDMD